MISDAMATYWTNFAKYGDPNGKGMPKWPAFSDQNPEFMYFCGDAAHRAAFPNEPGLKALDAYFAWRRSPEGVHASSVEDAPPATTNVFGAAYPRVLPDQSVVFQFKAPDAQTVRGRDRRQEIPMTRGSDGVWSVTRLRWLWASITTRSLWMASMNDPEQPCVFRHGQGRERN